MVAKVNAQDGEYSSIIPQSYTPKVLFVDDEQPVLNAMRRFARGRDWEVFTAISG